MSLGVVAVEQRVGRFPTLYGRNLPSQVMRVLQPGVQAQATSGRETMRRVADQEHPAHAVVVRNLRHQRPRQHVLDLNLVAGDPDRVAQDALARVQREALPLRHRGIVRVEHAPAALDVVGDQDAGMGRLHDPV